MEELYSNGQSYGVTFIAGTPLGLRLSPLGCGYGAVFDGWLESKVSKGENHERLMVGDRLSAIEGEFVGTGKTFTEIVDTVRAVCAQAEKSSLAENSASADGLLLQKTSTVRVTFTFTKADRYDSGKIVINKADAAKSLLRVWFRPEGVNMYGAKYVQCATNASPKIKKLFSGVTSGDFVLTVNNRAVEGLPFNQVIGSIQHSALPLEIEFAKARDPAPLNTTVDAGSDGGFEADEDENDFAVATAIPSREYKVPEEKVGRLHDQDAYFATMNVPYGLNHLANFFKSIEESDREYFTKRLESGQDLAVRDTHGRSPLHLAAALHDQEDSVWFTKHLLAEGLDVDVYDFANEATALHIAAGLDNVPLIEVLVQAGADEDAETKTGRTPVIEAAANCSPRALRYLLEHTDANPLVFERGSGWNCLHFISQIGREDMLEIVLSKVSPHIPTNAAPWRAPRKAIEIAREGGHQEVAMRIHESIASEPLQRVWPDAAPHVVTDDELATVDLPWRQGPNFKSIIDSCAAQRRHQCDRLRDHRLRRPPGRHDPAMTALIDKRLCYENVSTSGCGELWIGSKESLDRQIVFDKEIEAVVVLAETRLGFIQSEYRWLDKLPNYICQPAPHTFKGFAKELPKLVAFVHKQLEQNKRILIASADIDLDSPLEYPTTLAFATLILKYDQELKHLVEDFAQRCYFYTYKEGLEKCRRVVNSTAKKMTQEQLHAFQIRHEVRQVGRTTLSQEWEQGIEALQREKYRRNLQELRLRATHLSANFIM